MNRMICLALLSLALFAVPARAGVMQHPIGIQIWIPDTWSTETDEDLLMTTSPDEGAIVIFLVMKARDLNMAVREMDRELGQIIMNVRSTTQAEEIYINGMRGVSVEGVGAVEGVMVDWLSGLFEHRGHVLMVLGFAESSSFSSYEQMLVEVLNSLQPN